MQDLGDEGFRLNSDRAWWKDLLGLSFRIIPCLLCLAASGATFRWTDGKTENKTPRIYVEGPGSATLSDVHAALPKAPLEQISPGVWHLRAEIQVVNDAKLILHGTKIGGDVNQLRMQSNNKHDVGAFVFISADWGSIDIRSTAITSWDDDANGPDLEYATYERAFIRCRASLDTNGVTIHESRMDIIDSDVGYLGSHNAEAYGLVWKVIPWKAEQGTPPYGDITNLYNLVNVYGDIIHSRLHHNFFGHYSFGSYGQRMIDNEADNNIGYGFDPHDDSDLLVIEGNNVHHNGWHGIIASQRCNNIVIRNNVSWENGHNGIMLHRYCDDSIVEGNRSIRNADSGIAIFDTRRAIVRNNTCLGNALSGIRFSVGPTDCLVISNEFAYGANFGLYLYKGIDAPFPGDNGRPKRNRFEKNLVHHNAGSGIFLTTADDTSFTGNLFYENDRTMWLINGARTVLDSNSIPSEVVIRTQGTPSIPATTIIRNQSLANIQLDAFSSATFSDLTGRIFDPIETGLYTTVTAGGNSLTLTDSDVQKTSTVATRNITAVPDAGVALINIIIWNTSGDLSKRWRVQVGSATKRITFRIGDLDPVKAYNVIKEGVSTRITSDELGYLTYVDNAVGTGSFEYVLRPN